MNTESCRFSFSTTTLNLSMLLYPRTFAVVSISFGTEGCGGMVRTDGMLDIRCNIISLERVCSIPRPVQELGLRRTATKSGCVSTDAPRREIAIRQVVLCRRVNRILNTGCIMSIWCFPTVRHLFKRNPWTAMWHLAKCRLGGSTRTPSSDAKITRGSTC